MRKSELKKGDVLHFRNGEEHRYGVDKDIDMYIYTKDLKATKDLADGYEIELVSRNGKIIHECKAMTVDEVEQELGYKIQIIKG